MRTVRFITALAILFVGIAGQGGAQKPTKQPVGAPVAEIIARDDLRDAIVKAWLDAWLKCAEDVKQKIQDQPNCKVHQYQIENAPTDFFIHPATMKKLTEQEIHELKTRIGEAAKVGYYYGRSKQ